MRNLQIFALLAPLVAIASSSVLVRQDSDWKYSVGWDGVTLPSSDIGTPLSNDTHLQKRAVGGVYICTDINWGGTCGYAVQPVGECIVLGSQWNKKISSFGPDQCTVCYASSFNNCGSGETETSQNFWTFNYPGDATGGLANGANAWNDKISSFFCEQT
ncbi:hypothetical protein BC835DRAFT_1355549 [Cytidiella melzeri]|nr:hypothetical protein BC835DRAFT_1355549 [Cytidiella melzeri]